METSSSAAFDHHYRAFPISYTGKDHLENGNRIIMPPSALDHLSTLHIDYPMLFRLENTITGRHSNCGVMEFSAEEGFVFLPNWMIKNMQLSEGDLVNVKNTSLPKGSYMKIQPHMTKFWTISDHKSLLEETLKDFACLTVGDTIVIEHKEEKYHVDIVEAKPSSAISLFETDCEVDFERPLDYKEPEKKPLVKRKREADDDDQKAREDEDEAEVKFKPFTGLARRLDGALVLKEKKGSNPHELTKKAKMEKKKAVIDQKTEKPKAVIEEKMEKPNKAEFKPFTGVRRRLDGELVKEEDDHQSSNVIVKYGNVVDKKSTTEGTKKVEAKNEEKKVVQAFTGKSFRLTG